MFGAFRSTLVALGGLTRKRIFRLTPMQKLRQRRRLRGVDDVIAKLEESKVKLHVLDLAKKMPKESEMPASEKYWVESKRYRYGVKPMDFVPRWTKTPHPRQWKAGIVHEPKFGERDQ
ncbi:mitochondrial ribosomal protein L31-domain-containing protein [Cladochytrium replicatum]|nr:mitochondrial ribosomal protein L31-domain-containing protein [Cladochytrium replicatum]